MVVCVKDFLFSIASRLGLLVDMVTYVGHDDSKTLLLMTTRCGYRN